MITSKKTYKLCLVLPKMKMEVVLKDNGVAENGEIQYMQPVVVTPSQSYY